MTKVNVGPRSKAEDQKALAAQIEAAVETGEELIEEGGQQWLVKRENGLTIKTRIA